MNIFRVNPNLWSALVDWMESMGASDGPPRTCSRCGSPEMIWTDIDGVCVLCLAKAAGDW
jgi:hypothetical protein